MSKRANLRYLLAMPPLIACLFAGCALSSGYQMQGGPSDVFPEPGETVWIVEDTAMQSMQGTTRMAVDHRRLTRGSYGAVLPAGAQVEGVDVESHPAAQNTGSNAPLAHKNPWRYVRVIDSRYSAQVDWEGWVHNSALAHEETAPWAAPGQSLERASKLCPSPNANSMQCSQQVNAGTEVRVLGCEEGRMHVELWLEDGRYTNGYVNEAQFPKTTCP